MQARHLSSLTLLILLGSGAEAQAGGTEPIDAWRELRAPEQIVAGELFVAAHDPGRGVPSLILASSAHSRLHGSIEEVAHGYLRRHRKIWGAGEATVASAHHLYTHDTGRGGIIVVFRQMVGRADVFHGDVKVLLDRNRRLVAISGSLHPGVEASGIARSMLSAEEAIALGLRDLYGAPLVYPRLVRVGDDARHARYEPDGAGTLRFRRPARVRPVYFPLGDVLTPAYFVEVQAQERPDADVDVYQYVISAVDGRVLRRHDATAFESYSYRVYGEADGDLRPEDGPMTDFTPHPTGIPGEGPKAALASHFVTVEGLNHNPDAQPDPWLPPGATETIGNNVDAYADHVKPDGLNEWEFRANVTSPGVFDWPYDIDAEPLVIQTQSMAAIVNLFYVNNWLHDWWYDSGFDEAAGNAQMNNFDRGGEGGDPLLAEAQDSSFEGKRNNAVMSTPVDGESPRMEMYLWTAPGEAWIDVQPLGQKIAAGAAWFGPKNFDFAGAMVVVDDGQGETSDGCEPPMNDVVARVALVDRGGCSFEAKVANAESAGAIGVIVANNVDSDEPLLLGVDPNIVDPAIPALGITKVDGETLKVALQEPQTANLFRFTGTERDASLDNMIIAHEWGHFLHHRLTNCGSRQCESQSEGWGDFLALHTILRDGDSLAGVFPMSTYASATGDPSAYFGTRRVPYSVDMTKNALSFRHISDGEALPMSHPLLASGPNSEVHNAGEIWASMLWESYIALHQAYEGELTFADIQRRMSDYVVAGMILAPSEPTFTEQRDAILAAISASSVKDLTLVADAFARRGAGTCAVSPPKGSTDLVGVVEDFELSGRGAITRVTMSDSILSCDHDGIVDAGEIGEISVDVWNPGAAPLPAGSILEIVDPPSPLVLVGGAVAAVDSIGAQEALKVVFQVELDDALDAAVPLTLQVRLTTPGGCEGSTEVILPVIVHADLAAMNTNFDDVEAEPSAWQIGGGDEWVWSRQPALPDGYYWHAADVGHKSDTWLEGPSLEVSDSESFVIEFDHAFAFEFGEDTAWDGAVVEISSDGGKTWVDIADFVDPGYNGVIDSDINPLHKRQAFVDKNPSYPERDHVSLDLGSAFAASSVRVRFRVGTDAQTSAAGWDLDNLRFNGITNTPFPGWIAEQALCEGATTGGESESTGTESEGSGGDTAVSDSSSGTEGTGVPGTAGTAGTADSASDGGNESAGSLGSDGGSDDTATSGGEVVDDGCGCRSNHYGPGQLWGLLALAPALRRRRR